MFANILLTVSNGVAFYAAYVLWNVGIFPYLLIAAGLASSLFHSCEQHKHPALPGLYCVTQWFEERTLFLDRACAIIVALAVIRKAGLYVVLLHPVTWAALGVNVVSEMYYLRIVKAPEWDLYVYPWFHSAWHVLVFLIPIIVIY